MSISLAFLIERDPLNGLSPNGGGGSTPPSKKKLDHFPYKDFHRFSWEICASILITRLWLKGFFKWTAGSTRTQEAKWRCYHPPIRTLYIMKYLIPFLTRFFANVNLFWAFSSILAHYPSETSRKTGIYPSLYQKTHIAYISAYISAYFLTLGPSAGTCTFCAISQLLLNHFSSGLF